MIIMAKSMYGHSSEEYDLDKARLEGFSARCNGPRLSCNMGILICTAIEDTLIVSKATIRNLRTRAREGAAIVSNLQLPFALLLEWMRGN